MKECICRRLWPTSTHTYLKVNVNSAFTELSMCKCKNIAGYVRYIQKVLWQCYCFIPIYLHEGTCNSYRPLGIVRWCHMVTTCSLFENNVCSTRVNWRHHISSPSYRYRKTQLKLLWCPNSQTVCNFQRERINWFRVCRAPGTRGPD